MQYGKVMEEKNKRVEEKSDIVPRNNFLNGLRLRNPNIQYHKTDILYHLGLDNSKYDLEKMFGDVAFVCTGGTQKRMETFARYIRKEIGCDVPTGTGLLDISGKANRYSMYKVGPVLAVNHGMGVSSINILLHELFKLMYYARCKNPIFFRIGTCGGIGLQPGTVVVSSDAVDGMGNHFYEVPVLGKSLKRPCIFDRELVSELKSLTGPNDDYEVVDSTTMCAIDFYEGQGRLDGAFCSYTQEEKMQYLQSLYTNGVRNIEMEAVPFSALTYEAGIRAADVCVTLLDRLNGDQIDTPKEVLNEWENRPQEIIARYIKKVLGI